MGQAPETFTVQAVQENGKVVLENVNNPVDVSPKGTPVSVGQELRGWLNLTGKFGPYFKVAEDRSQGASNGSGAPRRDKATENSIEAQVAAKCAAEVLGAWGAGDGGQGKIAERVHFLTDCFYQAIRSCQGDDIKAPPIS